MPITPTRVALVAALLITLGVAWYVDGRGRWRESLADRLLYGVPWGTLVTVAVVVAFYLFAQGGFRHWDDPVVFAFVTWSYLYPTGLLTAGIAHASPAHLLSNMTATLVFGAIVEYAWGHYPGSSNADDIDASSEHPTVRADGAGDGPLDRPWVRAFVIFPIALLGVAFLTAIFSLGPGLGFSGVVFALIGFAVVVRPLVTVVGVVVTSTVSLVIDALAHPVVRETVAVGPPMPPEWAAIAFQAHLLGFLIGTVAGVALLARRRHRPSFAAITFGVFTVGAVQSLWLLVWPAEADEYVLYRGVGVTFVLALTLVLAGTVAGSDRRIPRLLGRFDRVPTRRTIAIGWLALVVLGFLVGVGSVIAVGEAIGLSLGILVVFTLLVAVPALPPVLPDRVVPTPISVRHTAAIVLVVVTVLVALVSVPLGLVAVGADSMPDEGAVMAGDYAVTYAENATGGQEWIVDTGEEEEIDDLGAENVSGVIVVSAEREIWTLGVDDELLAFQGEENVTVGAIGWRETVHVERTGWEVVGNDTVYAVDLTLNDETTRSFTSDPARANAELAGYTVEVLPTDDGFDLAVRSDGETVGTEPIPDANESTTVGDLSLSTVDDGETVHVVAETDDTRLQIAEKETYP